MSFNQWLVRYLYVPLGGREWRLVNVWIVFGFVALWHDAEWKLLAWAMLNAGFMVFEALGAQIYSLLPLQRRPEASRWLKAAAGGDKRSL